MVLSKKFVLPLLFTYLTAVSPLALGGDGPGGTGGGLAAPDGDLLDLWEGKVGNLKQFDPVQTTAFQHVLLPILKKLDEKVPGSAARLLVGLPPNMEWNLSDLPIAPSSDECKLVKSDNQQIAKQIDGELAISRQWTQESSDYRLAALMLHELIMYSLGKNPEDCATRVRRAVRAIFDVANRSEEDLQRELIKLGIYLKTRSQREQARTLTKEILNKVCVSDPLTPDQKNEIKAKANELVKVLNFYELPAGSNPADWLKNYGFPFDSLRMRALVFGGNWSEHLYSSASGPQEEYCRDLKWEFERFPEKPEFPKLELKAPISLQNISFNQHKMSNNISDPMSGASIGNTTSRAD
jgi:hypothetical protein